jgi:hypothetical protein
MVMVAALLVGLSACTDDDGGASTTTTEVTTTTARDDPTTTTGPPTTLPGTPELCSTAERSPSVFDTGEGQYAVHVTEIDGTAGVISFDVIQLLFGDAAIEAWDRAYPEEPGGPPNDYFIVNESPQVRSAMIDGSARVRVVRLGEGTGLQSATIDELASHVAAQGGNPWWLAFHDGRVVDVCEQYVP